MLHNTVCPFTEQPSCHSKAEKKPYKALEWGPLGNADEINKKCAYVPALQLNEPFGYSPVYALSLPLAFLAICSAM